MVKAGGVSNCKDRLGEMSNDDAKINTVTAVRADLDCMKRSFRMKVGSGMWIYIQMLVESYKT